MGRGNAPKSNGGIHTEKYGFLVTGRIPRNRIYPRKLYSSEKLGRAMATVLSIKNPILQTISSSRPNLAPWDTAALPLPLSPFLHLLHCQFNFTNWDWELKWSFRSPRSSSSIRPEDGVQRTAAAPSVRSESEWVSLRDGLIIALSRDYQCVICRS